MQKSGVGFSSGGSRQKPITLTVQSEAKNIKFDETCTAKILWEVQGTGFGHVSSIRDINSRTSPVSIVVMVDKSSSMKGEKMDLVKKTLCFFVENLKQTDSFGLYVFDKTISCLHPVRLLDPVNRKKALRRILDIQVGVWTNIETAVEIGCRSARKATAVHGAEKPLVSLLFLTDGTPTIGAKEKTKILAKTGDVDGFLIHTFGYGTPHDADTLKDLAQKGKGEYFFMRTEADVRETFTRYLGSIITASAIGVKLSLQALTGHFTFFKPNELLETRELGPNPTKITFDIGAVGEKKISMVTEMKIPPLERALGEGEESYIAEAELEFTNLGTGAHDVILDVVCINRTSSSTLFASSDRISAELFRLETLDLISAASEKAKAKKFEEAQSIIRERIALIDASRFRGPDIMALKGKLLSLLEGFTNDSAYEERGSYHVLSVRSEYSSGYSIPSPTINSINEAYSGYNIPSVDD